MLPVVLAGIVGSRITRKISAGREREGGNAYVVGVQIIRSLIAQSYLEKGVGTNSQ